MKIKKIYCEETQNYLEKKYPNFFQACLDEVDKILICLEAFDISEAEEMYALFKIATDKYNKAIELIPMHSKTLSPKRGTGKYEPEKSTEYPDPPPPTIIDFIN